MLRICPTVHTQNVVVNLKNARELKIIRIYISIILKFYKTVGLGTNFVSTTSLMLAFVILGYSGTILNLLEIELREMNKIVVIGIPIILFLSINFILSKKKTSKRLINTYESLNSREKIICGSLSFLFTLLSCIGFLKTYSH